MADPFIGEVVLFAGSFAPEGWALCDGQLLSIPSHTALFSILGTTFGGDGESTFALPDLRGRTPVHPGTGPGLSPVSLGERGGAENVLLTNSELPSHTHSATIRAASNGPTTNEPADGYVATPPDNRFSTSGDIDMASDSVSVGSTGGGSQFSIRNPYLGLNYIIALVGTFPSES